VRSVVASSNVRLMHNQRLALLVVVLSLVPDHLLACTPASHVDREAFYARLARPDFVVWGYSIALALLWVALNSRLHGSRIFMLVLVGLALLQPAWWVPANGGDCGTRRAVAALLVAFLSTGVFMLAVWRSRRNAWRRDTAADD
jgi:hypothetical protein